MTFSAPLFCEKQIRVSLIVCMINTQSDDEQTTLTSGK